MTDRAGRQPCHGQHRFCDRTAVLVLIGIVGDVPALDDRKRPAVEGAPFQNIRGRIERAEPPLRRRLARGGRMIAADRDGFAQIILADQHHQARFAGTKSRGAAVELAGLADHAAVLWRG